MMQALVNAVPASASRSRFGVWISGLFSAWMVLNR
jgi:hypothetical protein